MATLVGATCVHSRATHNAPLRPAAAAVGAAAAAVGALGEVVAWRWAELQWGLDGVGTKSKGRGCAWRPSSSRGLLPQLAHAHVFVGVFLHHLRRATAAQIDAQSPNERGRDHSPIHCLKQTAPTTACPAEEPRH
eukprot:GHVT01029186.1.p1 GENE.GHVT01029186.1~~GHVT01029186.1.p1  ORF type:complete len:135 (+),score=21.82 GHVT01029186.1:367-771(+)